MKRLLVYPLTVENIVFLKYKELINEYELYMIVSEKNSFYERYSDHPNIGLVEDIQRHTAAADTILLTKGNIVEERYLELINLAKSMDKELIIMPSVKELLRISANHANDSMIESARILNCHSEIDIPVISVMSLGEDSQKLELHLAIANSFKHKGYNVLNIGASNLSPYFNFIMMPAFMYANLSLSEKVYRFKAFVIDLLREENYDLVVVSVPGGTMPINRYEDNRFGELTHVISNALNIDINILNVYVHEDMNTSYIRDLLEVHDVLCKSKTEFVNLSCTNYEFDPEDKAIKFYSFTKEVLKKKIHEFNASNIMCSFYDLNTQDVFDSMESMLLDNYEVI